VNKKSLIGVSILAVVLLVMTSLSNVVGYQTVKSTVMNDSPLFSVRTQRATNQQQNILTFQYLGMGKGNLLQFPTRDIRNELLNKFIEIINEMEDVTFEQFTAVCIQKIRQDDSFSDMSLIEISQAFDKLRTKQETIMNPIIDRNNSYQTWPGPTCTGLTICAWFPGCILWIIILTIYSKIEWWLYGHTIGPFPYCDTIHLCSL